MVNDHTDKIQAIPAVATVGQNPRPDSSLSDRVRSLRLKEQPKKPSGRTPWLPWTLCLLLAASTGYLGYTSYIAPRSDGSQAGGESQNSISGGSVAGRSQDSVASSGDVVLERKGYIIPAHQILLSPKVSGVILEMDLMDKHGKYKLNAKGRKITLMEGLRVEKDDILAVLEAVDYQKDYDRTMATVNLNKQQLLELERGNRPEEIHQAKAELDEMEAILKHFELDYKRSAPLRPSSS